MKKEMKKTINHIARIEGQVKAIKKMIENEKECLDVITQIKAVRASLGKLAIELLKEDIICKNHKGVDEKFLKTLFKI